jgi:hypothetical protein
MDDSKNKLDNKFKESEVCKVMVADIGEKFAKTINDQEIDLNYAEIVEKENSLFRTQAIKLLALLSNENVFKLKGECGEDTTS